MEEELKVLRRVLFSTRSQHGCTGYYQRLRGAERRLRALPPPPASTTTNNKIKNNKGKDAAKYRGDGSASAALQELDVIQRLLFDAAAELSWMLSRGRFIPIATVLLANCAQLVKFVDEARPAYEAIVKALAKVEARKKREEDFARRYKEGQQTQKSGSKRSNALDDMDEDDDFGMIISRGNAKKPLEQSKSPVATKKRKLVKEIKAAANVPPELPGELVQSTSTPAMSKPPKSDAKVAALQEECQQGDGEETGHINTAPAKDNLVKTKKTDNVKTLKKKKKTTTTTTKTKTKKKKKQKADDIDDIFGGL
ncbi:Hypothetical Protein FCC1311_006112 [Hondaea fermentalgiana]|uniref:Uncharacterized protein n=1 Tax=Hondaea fermentalgiana TaxID=2315210 RepID=A0A2R5G7E9_9STRA|nr:Hypothetical Protein FCC1311_006112 [Hondaea fermentalgiana]|eukprot:GBG24393.1 Hypothetical Protein FCC1311_006112 [Hondaea fermentalgiana]